MLFPTVMERSASQRQPTGVVRRDPVNNATPLADVEVVLDISRLISRIHHSTPTGIDRVEMAYARELLRLIPEQLSFAALHPLGPYGRLPRAAVIDFLDNLEARWSGHGEAVSRHPVLKARWMLKALWRMRPRPLPRGALGRKRVLLQSSPHHLHDERALRNILDREQARFVCLLHDLIPMEYPEYARPGGAALHRRRIDTVARHAAAVIANSDATRQAFLPYLEKEGRTIPVEVALLGLDPYGQGEVAAPAVQPYFLCLGTIEPRKNHLLLLHIWRRLSEQFGAHNIPKLMIVGRRGWENEQIVDLLDRCPALVDCVEEYGDLPDSELRVLMKGARALLMPSFAEGFGMPVAEALALGVPVVCSDLPALREVGGAVPDYLDPLDGRAWIETILDFSKENSAGREAQLSRIASWSPPEWRQHIMVVVNILANINY
nr:glycosyltransferase family 1 protein [Sphingomonas haloaromaticamans]